MTWHPSDDPAYVMKRMTEFGRSVDKGQGLAEDLAQEGVVFALTSRPMGTRDQWWRYYYRAIIRGMVRYRDANNPWLEIPPDLASPEPPMGTSDEFSWLGDGEWDIIAWNGTDRELGLILGISEDAARKRRTRLLDKIGLQYGKDVSR